MSAWTTWEVLYEVYAKHRDKLPPELVEHAREALQLGKRENIEEVRNP